MNKIEPDYKGIRKLIEKYVGYEFRDFEVVYSKNPYRLNISISYFDRENYKKECPLLEATIIEYKGSNRLDIEVPVRCKFAMELFRLGFGDLNFFVDARFSGGVYLEDLPKHPELENFIVAEELVTFGGVKRRLTEFKISVMEETEIVNCKNTEVIGEKGNEEQD